MWKRISAALIAVLCLVIVGVGFGAAGAGARHQDDPPQDRALSMFMQAKLDHSKDVLEGLATGDFTKVVQGAEALRMLTENALWRVSPNITYERYTEEFIRLTEAMAADGRAENIDGATLNYVNMTINCVNCHKFVRDRRVTAIDAPTLLR